MTEDGYIQPEQKYLDPMFFRKPGLPLLMVEWQMAVGFHTGIRFIRRFGILMIIIPDI